MAYDMYTTMMRHGDGVMLQLRLDCTFGLATRDVSKYSTYF